MRILLISEPSYNYPEGGVISNKDTLGYTSNLIFGQVFSEIMMLMLFDLKKTRKIRCFKLEIEDDRKLLNLTNKRCPDADIIYGVGS